MTSVRTGIAHQPRGQTGIEWLLLEEVSVKAWVVDVSSRIILTQTFHNSSNEATQRAKYVFPLPANAAVCAFELQLEDGSVIIGEVKEKEEAALAFTRAVEQGKTTALVERVTDDVFTISIGSIPANSRVTAYLTFIMDVLDNALRDHVRLQLPMHIAERYGTPPAAMQDASIADSRTRLHISVDIQTSDVIRQVYSPTHPIKVRRYKRHSGVKSQRYMSAVWKSSEFLASDFVITIHADGLDKPRCFAEVLDARGDGQGFTVAMQLTLVPKFLTPKVTSQEYIFVIDKSFSMQGSPMETAKRTLVMLLRLLPHSQTTFNILSFASDVQNLWQSSQVHDQTSLMTAISYVQTISVDGGTEIPSALQSAFGSRRLDRPAVVFLLTDGQVNVSDRLDPFRVISTAIQNSPSHAPVRLFVLGIGPDVSSDVCSRLARAGGGEYLFAVSAEEICAKCAQLLNAGRMKNIERIHIDWGGDTLSPQTRFSSPVVQNLPAGIPALVPPPAIQQAPHSLTKIFSGIRFTVFAITSFRTVPTSVKLITKLEGVSESRELTVDVTKVKPFRDSDEQSTVPIVHTLAARKLIMELDEKTGPLPTPAPGDALLVSEDDLRKAGIVRLGLTYQLVSKHTSFVALEKEDRRVRNRRRGRGNMAWIRSRLAQTESSVIEDTPVEAPTFLDSLIDGVASFITSLLGFQSSPARSTTTTTRRNPHSTRRPDFPGAFDETDSGTGRDSGRGRGSASHSVRRSSPASHHSTDTFSTLSSLEGTSCSSCWTSSRSPTPPPRLHDPIERAPSPEFLLDANHTSPAVGNPTARNAERHTPISQEVYDLFGEMGVDGSFVTSSLLKRLVGDAVLDQASALRIDAKVWATVVAAAYMKKHLQDEPDLLELVSEKAREFVEAYSGGVTGDDARARQFDKWLRKAAELLEPNP